jgi:hypothetical protein
VSGHLLSGVLQMLDSGEHGSKSMSQAPTLREEVNLENEDSLLQDNNLAPL